MEKSYLVWRKNVRVLLVCTLLYILAIPMNVLYTNTFVLNVGFLPARLTTYRVYGTLTYGMRGHLFGAHGMHPDSICGLLNEIETYHSAESNPSKIYLKTILEYGFNFRDIYIKVLDVNGETHWLSPVSFPDKQFSKYKLMRQYRYFEVSETEAKSQSRLIWINLVSINNKTLIVWVSKLLDLINRTIVIPIVFIVALVLTIMLLYRKYPVEPTRKRKYTFAVVFVLGFPIITLIIHYLICIICRLGLLIYTYI